VPDYANVWAKVVAILGVINRALAHNVFGYFVTVAQILTPSENLAFGPKSGLKNKCRARAGFGLQSEALLQLCVGMFAEGNKGRLKRYILYPPTVK